MCNQGSFPEISVKPEKKQKQKQQPKKLRDGAYVKKASCFLDSSSSSSQPRHPEALCVLRNKHFLACRSQGAGRSLF